MDEVEEIDAGDTVWRFDRSFLTSRWTCIWGRGCLGILDEPAEHLGQGCCSVGAELADEDEARLLSALAACLEPERFEHNAAAAEGGIFRDDERNATRVVDGACIFLNRPGFAGGAGCALHLAATDAGEPPREWKPGVCGQLPLRVDWEERADGVEVATVRRWSRADWGDEGETMAWCCTEGDRAYVGESPVVDSLGEELEALAGTAVHVELRRRLSLSPPGGPGPERPHGAGGPGPERPHGAEGPGPERPHGAEGTAPGGAVQSQAEANEPAAATEESERT